MEIHETVSVELLLDDDGARKKKFAVGWKERNVEKGMTTFSISSIHERWMNEIHWKLMSCSIGSATINTLSDFSKTIQCIISTIQTSAE